MPEPAPVAVAVVQRMSIIASCELLRAYDRTPDTVASGASDVLARMNGDDESILRTARSSAPGSGRVHHARRRRPGDLRRQGGEPAQPCALVLRIASEHGGQDPRPFRVDRRLRVRRDAHRAGGAAPRGRAGEAASTDLQRTAEG